LPLYFESGSLACRALLISQARFSSFSIKRIDASCTIYFIFNLCHILQVVAATARTKTKLPPLTEDSIKKGIKELEEGEGKKIRQQKRTLQHLKSLPKE
jgi:hypothetical protein